MARWAAVILAAGKGTRMRSKIPKVLHPIAGREMVRYVIDAVRQAGGKRIILVVGFGAAQVREALREEVEYVVQGEPLGTGHALLQARPKLEGREANLLVLNADIPLITAQTLRALMDHHLESQATITFLSARGGDPQGLGRVLRDSSGRVLRVVEEVEADEAHREIDEINGGVYCFDPSWLWPHLAQLTPSSQGEIFLTDIIGRAADLGVRVEALMTTNPTEILGVNHRLHLARAEAVIRQRVRERMMLAGVTIVDPPSTFIDATVDIGQDTIIYPNTFISGTTRIGAECQIGPGTILSDSIVGDRCRLQASIIEGSILEEGVEVGPFSHIRPDSYIEAGVHIGNFAEVKKSRLGRGTRMGHFSYLGDATVGRNVNIGAGAITCNFDGVRKHPSVIEDDVFIGSDSLLIAPVRVGARAATGAGSVINHDVPPDTLAVGAPARFTALKRPGVRERGVDKGG